MGDLVYIGAVKAAMVETMARLKKPPCDSSTLEKMSDMCTVEATADSTELAEP
jgi:hypothetical protein